MTQPLTKCIRTFQEGYLARRRLIFTDHEVFFLCDRMYCQECVEQQLQHRLDMTWDGQDASHLFGVIPNRNREDFSANHILEEYTGKTLSYPTDALNACLGILKAARIQHLGGLPIEVDNAPRRSTLNLQWANAEPSSRRAGFATWSWTSVVGQKRFPEVRRIDDVFCKVLISATNDQWLSAYEWMHLGENIDMHHTDSLLRVAAPFVNTIHLPVGWLTSYRAQNNHGLHMVIQTPAQRDPRLPSTKGYVFRLHLDAEPDSDDHLSDAVAVFVQAGSKKVPRTYTVLLILKPYGDRFERVGITDWSNAWCCNHVGGRWEGLNEHSVPDDTSEHFPRQTIYLR